MKRPKPRSPIPAFQKTSPALLCQAPLALPCTFFVPSGPPSLTRHILHSHSNFLRSQSPPELPRHFFHSLSISSNHPAPQPPTPPQSTCSTSQVHNSAPKHFLHSPCTFYTPSTLPPIPQHFLQHVAPPSGTLCTTPPPLLPLPQHLAPPSSTYSTPPALPHSLSTFRCPQAPPPLSLHLLQFPSTSSTPQESCPIPKYLLHSPCTSSTPPAPCHAPKHHITPPSTVFSFAVIFLNFI